MRFSKNDMVEIAVKAEARSENPDYFRIMKKFDRVLRGESKCVRLSINEKDLIWYMYEDSDKEAEITAKLYI